MTLKRHLQLLLPLAAVLLLGSCAKQGLTADDAKQDAQLPLALFLQKRFPPTDFPVMPPAVTYVAWYRQDSSNMLHNPAYNLALYCEAQGGTLLSESTPKGAVLSGIYPDAAYEPVAAVLQKNKLGVFVCRAGESGPIRWRASIWPIRFLPATKDTFGSFRLVLEIKPV